MLGAMLGACATHMPDAVHERTNELTNAEHPHTTLGDSSSVGNAGARVEPPGFVYIVHWPEAQFTKVGCSVDSRRWRPFLRRGGVLLDVLQPVYPHYTIVEWRMHVDLGTSRVPRKFTTSAEARPYLGGTGRGFTECYVDQSGQDVLAKLAEIEKRAPGRWSR